MSPRPFLFALALFATLTPAAARAADDLQVFADKPFKWRENDADKRFVKTRLFKALSEKPKDPACQRVVATYLTLFAEGAPYVHKRDGRFPSFLFTYLSAVSTRKFPADEYLLQMLRYGMLEKKAPEDWLATAKELHGKGGVQIDLGRLAYAVDGPQPIDNFNFTIPALFERFRVEVALATSVAEDKAQQKFMDNYLDRDVTWGGLVLADIRKVDPAAAKKPAKGKKAPAPAEDDEDLKPYYEAVLVVPTPAPPPSPVPVVPSVLPGAARQRPAPSVRVSVRLLPEQYIDVRNAVVTRRYAVRGRLWGFEPGGDNDGTPTMTLQLRDGLLFEEMDWSRYAGLARAEDFASCELCVNDLSAAGLKEHQGVGARDGFSH